MGISSCEWDGNIAGTLLGPYRVRPRHARLDLLVGAGRAKGTSRNRRVA